MMHITVPPCIEINRNKPTTSQLFIKTLLYFAPIATVVSTVILSTSVYFHTNFHTNHCSRAKIGL